MGSCISRGGESLNGRHSHITRHSRTLSNTQIDKLTNFVNVGYENAKIKGGLWESIHQKEVEIFVKNLLMKVQNLCPIFKIQKILENGSYYHNTKTLQPDEKDFLVMLDIQNVNIIKELSHEVKIEIQEGPMLEVLKKYEHLLQEEERGKYYLGNIALVLLFMYVTHDCLKAHQEDLGVQYHGLDCLDDFHIPASWELFNRYNNLRQKYGDSFSVHAEWPSKADHDPNIERKHVILDYFPHGPSVRVRFGGLVCTVDLDLCLCIEIPHTCGADNGDRYVAVPRTGRELWSEDINWCLSYYEDPSNLRLDEDHRKILIVLKNLLSESKHIRCATMLPNSHILKTFVLHHQKRCHKKPVEQRFLGDCLDDIVHHMLEKWGISVDHQYISGTEIKPQKLPDFDFPYVYLNLSEHGMKIQIFFLYVLMYLAKADSQIAGGTLHSIDRWLIINEVCKYVDVNPSRLALRSIPQIQNNLIRYFKL